MKVLIYEPGTRGHRPVVAGYVVDCFRRMGVDYVMHVTECGANPVGLIACAIANRCDCIYVLCVDGKYPLFFGLSLLARFWGIRTLGNYYLYDNLFSGVNAAIWWWIITVSQPLAILVSKRSLRSKSYLSDEPVQYLCDPVDITRFSARPVGDSRARFGIPDGTLVVTLFGEIDERKGADWVLRLFAKCGDELCGILLFIAGRHSEVVVKLLENNPQLFGRVVSINRRIDEDEVSAVFAASDYILCPYPKSFGASSGTASRALVSGRELIASRHGETGAMVSSVGCGFVFDAEDEASFLAALKAARESWGRGGRSTAQHQARRALEVADRSLMRYQIYLEGALFHVSSARVV